MSEEKAAGFNKEVKPVCRYIGVDEKSGEPRYRISVGAFNLSTCLQSGETFMPAPGTQILNEGEKSPEVKS